MVGTEVLIVGIVVPLVVGPVSIFFKTLWDRYSDSKEEKRKNHYETRLKELKNKIDLFYWPVYIKLKCLYSLNYNDNKFKNNKLSNNLLSDNESDRDEKINNFIKSKFVPKIKKIRKKKISVLSDNNNYNTDNSLDWEDDIKLYNRNTDIELLDDSEISSDDKYNSKDLQKDKISVKVDDIFIQELDKKISLLSLEIKSIIENNISIIKPNKDLINEIVRFVRLTEMINIVNESNDKINNQDLENIKNISLSKNIKTKKHYHYDNMGVVNNTRNFYRLIKEELDNYMLEYQDLFNEYNNLQNFKNCSKIFNCQNKT
tara:strand:+ start:159 stop:1106 length:948 start_codon:yes stop_codon:yes gene_type:complete